MACSPIKWANTTVNGSCSPIQWGSQDVLQRLDSAAAKPSTPVLIAVDDPATDLDTAETQESEIDSVHELPSAEPEPSQPVLRRSRRLESVRKTRLTIAQEHSSNSKKVKKTNNKKLTHEQKETIEKVDKLIKKSEAKEVDESPMPKKVARRRRRRY